MWDGGGHLQLFYMPSQELWIGWEERENSGHSNVGVQNSCLAKTKDHDLIITFLGKLTPAGKFILRTVQ